MPFTYKSKIAQDTEVCCAQNAVCKGEFWSFQYFKDTDLRKTQNLNKIIETKNGNKKCEVNYWTVYNFLIPKVSYF